MKALPVPGVRWRGLTVQLFIAVVLPLTALLIALAVGAAYLHQQAMRSLVGERDQRATVSLARALEEQLLHRTTAVQGLAASLGAGVPPMRLLASSGYLKADFTGGLAVATPEGRLLAAQPAADWWRALLQRGGTSWWPRRGAAFSAPLTAPNGVTVVLVAATTDGQRWVLGAFQPDALARQTLQGAFPTNDAVRVGVVDGAGRLLFALPAGDTVAFQHAGIAAALRGESGVIYTTAADGEHVVAFSPIPPVGWALIVEEPWEKVANPWLHTTQLVPLLLAPVLVLALVALWFGARRVVEPLQQLESRAAALAWGDYQALAEPVEGIEEVQRLQRALHHMAQKVQRAHESLRGYIGAITAGQEEERRRLARELHDDTLQSLIALQQRIQLARLRFGESSPLAENLSELQQLTETSIRELRRLIRGLRPLYLEDLGLLPALEMLVRETQEEGEPLRVEFVHQGDVRRLEAAQELALYRIVQEGLSNVIRHAQATWAQVAVRFEPERLLLEIRDNGSGFRVPESPAEFAPQGHYGLLGMQERAELIGARLKIRSTLGQGTQIVLSLPLTPPSAA